MRRRVVVTGIGCVSPVGNDSATTWNSVRLGKSGAGPITLFDAEAFPTRIAAEVKNFFLADWVDGEQLELLNRAGRNVHFGVVAAKQAIADSGLDPGRLKDRTRFGVYLGAGEGIPNFELLTRLIVEALDGRGQFDLSRFTEISRPFVVPEVEYNNEPNVLCAILAGMFGAEGPNINNLTACAASAQAIGEGAELIRSGTCDVMIVGGAHSMIHPFGLTGFCLLGPLSTRNENPIAASRPFDRGRDGFVLAEGAAMLILEEFSSAKRRRAKIYGEIRGFGLASDAYRLTDVPEDGNGLARAIQRSLQDAALNADDIDYVNAHGTSTNANDRAETQAIKRAFGQYAFKIPVSGTKGSTGHLIAASGALEAVISLLSIGEGVIPPTANYECQDPDCDLDYVPNIARDARVRTVMSNSCGFGGQNVSLIFSSV